jgi:4-amino-4-deoxy-L-arabinose transferase-like glycosyltransferase
MPLLLLKGIWPALATRAFAGNIMSAVFMAGCVVVLHGALADLRIRRPARLALTVVFAIQPMIVYYGANGMSEAIFMFFLLLASRQLARWLNASKLWDLVLAGLAFALAYLARNEAVMPAFLAGVVVTGVTFVRWPGDIRRRARSALLNCFVLAAPAAFAFLLWAAISWVIVGHPFEQFSSQYGNASQIRVLGASFRENQGDTHSYVTLQLLALAPMLPLAVLGASWTAWRHRDLRFLAPCAALGGVVVFAVMAYLGGQTAGWLRYYITIIPLAHLLAGCAIARSDGVKRARLPWTRAVLGAILAISLTAPAMATSVLGVANNRIGREETQHLSYLFHARATAVDIQERNRYRTAAGMAGYLDAKHLPIGSVVVDTFSTCVPFVVLASKNPKQFVITNDRDFQPVLADPVAFGAKYLLVPPRGGYGELDEINRTFPSLYENGGGIADMDHEFSGDAGCPAMRLYALNSAASAARS